MTLTAISKLEAEAIHIIRESFVHAKNPVILFSIGKDSSVLLHLAKKAFAPSPLPIPLLHIDTGWKFSAMYTFRDKLAAQPDINMLVHKNPAGSNLGINPFDHTSDYYTEIMKTNALKQAIDSYEFDLAFGGSRRDEEKSRAKERIFSFRNAQHYWDPKNQRPEPWRLYNTMRKEGESIRVFPLSNWTELDVWQYIERENIEVVPLYFAKIRPVVIRDNFIMMVDDHRAKLLENEQVLHKRVRFRTLGCYPLTGAIESNSKDLTEIISEITESKVSERRDRLIDFDPSSMEQKKKMGYF